MVLQEQAIFQRLSEKRWAVLLQITGNGTVTCQMNVTGENKEESAKVSKKDKKGKSGKNVPSYLL